MIKYIVYYHIMNFKPKSTFSSQNKMVKDIRTFATVKPHVYAKTLTNMLENIPSKKIIAKQLKIKYELDEFMPSSDKWTDDRIIRFIILRNNIEDFDLLGSDYSMSDIENMAEKHSATKKKFISFIATTIKAQVNDEDYDGNVYRVHIIKSPYWSGWIGAIQNTKNKAILKRYKQLSSKWIERFWALLMSQAKDVQKRKQRRSTRRIIMENKPGGKEYKKTRTRFYKRQLDDLCYDLSDNNTLPELRALAKQLKMQYVSRLNKPQLCKRIAKELNK